MSQRIVGVGRDSLLQKVSRRQRIEDTQLYESLRIKARNLSVRRERGSQALAFQS